MYLIIGGISASYGYSKQYSANWELADKSSTIQKKSDYINKFVLSLEQSGLQGSNGAMFLKTDNTSFDSNMDALKSLQGRLDTIKTLDENSFAYQTAIQQITAQEQGEAQSMLSVFRACWMKVHHYLFWNEFLILGMILLGVGLIIGGSVALDDYNY
jgi:hypothetical protein